MKQSSLKKKISFAFVIAIIVFCMNFVASIYTFEVLIGRLSNYSSSLSELNEFRYEFGELNTTIEEYFASGSADSLESYNELNAELSEICENIYQEYTASDDDVQVSLATSISTNYTKYSQQIDELINLNDRANAIQLYNDKYSKNAGYIENYIEKLISYRYNTSEETLADTNQKVRIFEILHISAFIILAITLSVLGVIIFKKVIAPIEKLTRQSKQISNYNFDIEIDKLNTNDEISALADTFRDMKDNLKTAFESSEKNIQMAETLLNQHQVDVSEDIFREANFDRMTNTMNKGAFIRYVNDGIQTRALNMACVLFLVNIENYTELSLELCEGADDFLKLTAQRLNVIFESYGYVSRLDKEVFAGFSANINSIRNVNELCSEISSSLSTPFKYNNTVYNPSINIGVYFCPNPLSAESMIEFASIELSKAKEDENNNFSIAIG